jgi:hypothetical protein
VGGVRPPIHGGGQAVKEVVWEVEVELEAMVRLREAFVGFLTEPKDSHAIQYNFMMDGYKNISVSPLEMAGLC